MKLYLLSNDRMLLSPDAALSEESATALARHAESWLGDPKKGLAIFPEPIEVVDLREPRRSPDSIVMSPSAFDAAYSASRGNS